MLDDVSLDQFYRITEIDSIKECLYTYHPFTCLPIEYQEDLAKLIERGFNNACYDKAKERNLPKIWDDERYVEQYSTIGHRVKINIDVTSSVNVDQPPHVKYYVVSRLYNYELRKIILAGGVLPNMPVDCLYKILSFIPTINPGEVAYIPSHVLNPYHSQKYIEEIKVRESQTINHKFTQMYECGECSGRKATYINIQTCSLDEDTTMFLTCELCGHGWQIY